MSDHGADGTQHATADRQADLLEFWIDVGGTFTDCFAAMPMARSRAINCFSTGVTKGGGGRFDRSRQIIDPAPAGRSRAIVGRLSSCGWSIAGIDRRQSEGRKSSIAQPARMPCRTTDVGCGPDRL